MIDNTLRVSINADIRGLNAGLNKAQSKLKSFGSRLQGIGSQLQTRLALPLIAGGTAAIKMAADFDKSMTKIKTLVGIAGADVDAMGSSVKAFATAAGVSSGEAAEAMFFITSANLRGADAMSVLEQSTKAAALGLGSTATIADLATSAMNAYGVKSLSATNATDVLTAAVREGKLEASELSSAMGQTLPVASNMGIKFHEVGAAFAAMSRTGTNAAQASTQLNSIMMGIMKPTKDAEKAMLSLGLSKEKLRQQIREKGLLSVLQTLRQASIVNSEAFERVFGNVRAVRGILDLTGASMGDTVKIFDRMSNTAGMTQQAFEELQKSSEFRLRKGLRSLQNQFTDLGAVLMDSLMPLIQNVIGFFSSLFTAFQNLDPVTQQIAIGMAAFAAVLPTILSLGGNLLGIFAALVSPIGLIAAGVAGIAYVIYKNWNEVLPVVVGLYNRFVDLYNSFEPLRQAVYGIKSAFGSVFIGIRAQIDQVINVFKTMWNLIKEFSEKGIKGSFGDILEQGFEDGKGIATKAGDDIAKLFAENYKKAINSRLEYATAEGVQTSLSNGLDFIKSFATGMFGGIGIKAPKIPQLKKEQNPFYMFGKGHITGQVIIDGLDKFANKTEKITEGTKKLTEATNQLAMSVGQSLMGAFESLAAGGNFFQSLIDGLKQLLIKLAAAAAAAAILFVLTGGASAGGSDLGTFKTIFGQLSGLEMANGGIVSGPTHALIGEYSGARSNPEVVAPLDKLKGMIAQTGSQNINVGGEFRIQGQDLVVALQRAERNRKRIL